MWHVDFEGDVAFEAAVVGVRERLEGDERQVQAGVDDGTPGGVPAAAVASGALAGEGGGGVGVGGAHQVPGEERVVPSGGFHASDRRARVAHGAQL